MIALPVADSPVKVIASTPGCRVRNSPAESGPKPCTRLNTPVRHAGGGHHLGEQRRRGRGLLAGLDHHGVAAGQRRSDLPGQQQQRQVPRHDDRDHADRLADRVVQRPAAGRGDRGERLGRRGRHDLGERPEVRRAARDVQRAGLARWTCRCRRPRRRPGRRSGVPARRRPGAAPRRAPARPSGPTARAAPPGRRPPRRPRWTRPPRPPRRPARR